MMNRWPPGNRPSVRGLLRRADRVAGDLNVLLVVIAVGLAVLDTTFLVTQKVVERLPITRVVYTMPADQPAHQPAHKPTAKNPQ